MCAKIKVAILDDYQNVSQDFADWSVLSDQADVVVFNEPLTNIAENLHPFEIVCVMRERMPLNKALLTALPNLRLVVSTGFRNASIDIQAAEELGITVKNTGYVWSGAPELTWALLMALAKKIPKENGNFTSGKWQTTIGIDLEGKTIGIVGLGNIGSKIASYAKAFGMHVIAWSENLTEEKATAAGARLVSKETLFKEADFVSVHLVLSDRSRGIITSGDLNSMKSSSFFINTSRAPLVDEVALIDVLQQRKIAGAALDVFSQEPLPADHIYRSLDNLLATPHIGYVTENTYKVFYQDTLKAIQEWLH
ncbi:D-2-hydroxyacid dehydrogenase family protein [Dyadobacter psychrotolerans]|uniref:D-2-hydroxyacid dehydrogenase family protein n=1 Tax=Dyadobacter psychrotolerans TaxID=2541721 RepID=A0A4R5DXD7_9BACT|nr:D-2-hydroxyacid dehydrogenase family protein [Dyadobacter psychrotolerans]TDE17110.1 D-2-hydroxyacid dehydrogenase family protein [Dyadobacter psychrotolerans]